MFAHHASDFGRGAIEDQEVIFEYFNPVEACARDRLELLFELAADGYRGNRRFHFQNPVRAHLQKNRAALNKANSRFGIIANVVRISIQWLK